MSNQKKLIRQKFRDMTFARDNYKCKICGCGDKTLDAHHITDRKLMPNGGYVKENGINL
jgi:5-methylcytosine-specific restriction endonuclease McrA